MRFLSFPLRERGRRKQRGEIKGKIEEELEVDYEQSNFRNRLLIYGGNVIVGPLFSDGRSMTVSTPRACNNFISRKE